MKSVMSFIVRHPCLSFIAVILVTSLFMIPLPKLIIDPSAEGLMISGDPDIDFYDEVKETFGDDILVSICITSDNVFQEPILQTIQNLSDEIQDITLPIDGEDVEVVARVVSLTTVNKIIGDDGYLDTGELIEDVTSDEDELAVIKRNALSNPIMINDIVSSNSKTASVNVYIKESPPLHFTYNQEVTERIQALIDSEIKRLKGKGIDAEIFQIGFPVVKVTIAKYLEQDMVRLVPLCLLTSLIILVWSFRSVIAVTIPMITGIFSVIWTLGFMAAMGYTINAVTNIVPLLLLVIGCTEDIHMLSEYSEQLKAGNEKLKAIRNMAIKCGLAIFLTSLTTLLGFSTLTVNKITLLKEFGISASFGLGFNFLVTILVLPTVLRWTKIPKNFGSGQTAKPTPKLDKISDLLFYIAVNKRPVIMVVTLTIMIWAAVGATKVKLDSDFIGFFKSDSEVRVKLDRLSELMAGGQSFFVIIDTEQDEGIKNPEVMTAMAKLQTRMNDVFGKTISVADQIKIMHREMNDGKAEFFTVPDSEELISQYLLMVDAEEVEPFMDTSSGRACIVVRHNVRGTWRLNEELAKIEAYAKEIFPSYVKLKVTGETILVNKGADSMSIGQVFSLSLASIFIFIIISILFVSPKAGLLAMVPNIIPILMNFGIMGWFDIALSPGTCTIAVVALGVAVDDTIHLMVRFHKELKKTSDQNEAMEKTIRAQLLPVLSTSIGLAVGFFILILSNLVTNMYFGYLASIAMVMALTSDLLVGPALLLSTQLISSWDLLKVKINEDLVRTSTLFKDLKLAEIKKVVLLGVISGYKDSDYIVRKGDDSQHMYMIVEGNVEVVVQEDEKEKKFVKTLGRGDIFGEMAFVTGNQRTADIMAKGDVEVLTIDHQSLNNVKARFPKIAAKIYYNLSSILSLRLKETTSAWAKQRE